MEDYMTGFPFLCSEPLGTVCTMYSTPKYSGASIDMQLPFEKIKQKRKHSFLDPETLEGLFPSQSSNNSSA